MNKKEKEKYENLDTDIELGDVIQQEAEILALKHWKKPFEELSEFNRSEVIRMAENMVLGLR
tara:strand:- start:568 stop:753 length:186 start_codon:yes stop_codon:yes gene_type:complete